MYYIVLKRTDQSLRYEHDKVVLKRHEPSLNDQQRARLETSRNVITHKHLIPIQKRLETTVNVLYYIVLKRTDQSLRYEHDKVVLKRHEPSLNDQQRARLETSRNVITHKHLIPIQKRLETTVNVFLIWIKQAQKKVT